LSSIIEFNNNIENSIMWNYIKESNSMNENYENQLIKSRNRILPDISKNKKLYNFCIL